MTKWQQHEKKQAEEFYNYMHDLHHVTVLVIHTDPGLWRRKLNTLYTDM